MTEVIIFGAMLATVALIAWASKRGISEPNWMTLQRQHHQGGAGRSSASAWSEWA